MSASLTDTPGAEAAACKTVSFSAAAESTVAADGEAFAIDATSFKARARITVTCSGNRSIRNEIYVKTFGELVELVAFEAEKTRLGLAVKARLAPEVASASPVTLTAPDGVETASDPSDVELDTANGRPVCADRLRLASEVDAETPRGIPPPEVRNKSVVDDDALGSSKIRVTAVKLALAVEVAFDAAAGTWPVAITDAVVVEVELLAPKEI